MRPAKVAVVGSYNVGLTVQVDDLPVWGQTVLGTGLREGSGGKGSNQAVAAARLGADVQFVGCFGNDSFAAAGLAMLRHEGVGTSYCEQRVDCRTGCGIIYVHPDGDNCIVVDAGANALLQEATVEQARALIAAADVLLVQLEAALPATSRAMRIAREAGVTVVLNPAPAVIGASNLLALADIVTPNRNELAQLCGVAVSADLTAARLRSLADQLLACGPAAVAVTLGAAGALVVEQSGTFSVPAPQVPVVDTTGAGDCFCAALAVALAEHLPLQEAVDFACCAAALSVTAGEVIPALPVRAAVTALRGQRWRSRADLAPD